MSDKLVRGWRSSTADMAIRKLTPKECFRLQAFTDEDYEKAAFVNSDSQLYKQAGNSVTVSVIRDIAERMGNEESRNERDCATYVYETRW